ncbi:hypothetical protein [Nodularia sphaerocarpa]|uniref:hypothetical protein n=1 Tax=Nodularia sphaerocarpa TaxID=137816 RepID=UPI001EFBE854|nr:hypothetical protein [Nodularia sphaerocarpa]MDB9371854.1 hypothetical protein [Nodularia sphaerocarpa CS-585]MDB9380025.1 hypothetical protein [Nodularia sphaerocarpa CS-585A2]ULP71243.1 hypothetical protein BDGGKGIB_00868 [Nodularia sphaerocarpa UHCC 0038]
MSAQKHDKEEILSDFLQSLQDRELIIEEENSYGEEYTDKLKIACNNLLQKESFQVGQLVKWKEYLKNRKIPHKKQPAIVVAVLDEPITSSEDESGSPYFLETLDIILGIMIDDNTFLTFYYDSRRFEAY